MTEGSFEGIEGVKIFTREWQPAGEPRGVVVISHGLNAHSGLYEWTAQQFTSNGLAVHALDHRGRGRSEGERFFVKKFTDWTKDLATFIDIVKTREAGLPVFLLGHSAGGVIACGYALEHQDEIAGLICEDFAYQVPAPDVALAILKGVSYVAPHAHVLKLKNDDFSRDPAVVANERRPADRQRVAAERDGRRAGARQRIAQEDLPTDHPAAPHPPRHRRQGDETERQQGVLREGRLERQNVEAVRGPLS